MILSQLNQDKNNLPYDALYSHFFDPKSELSKYYNAASELSELKGINWGSYENDKTKKANDLLDRFSFTKSQFEEFRDEIVKDSYYYGYAPSLKDPKDISIPSLISYLMIANTKPCDLKGFYTNYPWKYSYNINLANWNKDNAKTFISNVLERCWPMTDKLLKHYRYLKEKNILNLYNFK
ncbi:MAG: hypothetical protein QS2022_0520 [Candidatus Phytoplasma asteris]|uniref:Uncharacterized protein n=2 Tax=16SrI (Aster yellows group) TaxID=3042590 RepID=Q6YRI1_ONYPE|nr:hypothetical protein ['Chrysanthemum coronarium' phytoplasma]TKA88243.1 MAG: hypothetical protein PLY_0520 [Periwinkle leaf yellowing phytoplasma]WEX19342.1 MAG: hypothetical protein QS2022_0520 [Candidatus Phytoplasma asteris]BAD04119.1 hypothetical protein PAM_034 [Onion yellows phytoplasma OY-M]GAK73633.1 chromosome segregation ATPases ['Chrysanthemum coronarium' phytoplasma]